MINLGTNDGGNSLKPQYSEIYTKLVMDAAKNYGPKLNVFMACGPMSEVYCKPIVRPAPPNSCTALVRVDVPRPPRVGTLRKFVPQRR